MNKPDKQPSRPSNADVPAVKRQPPTDVSPQGTSGGDKESNEPLQRPLRGGAQAGRSLKQP